MINVKVTLLAARQHDLNSSELAFEQASALSLRAAAEAGRPVQLEPIMRVEIVTPDDYVGEVIGDLNSRGAIITDTDVRDGIHTITASVALSKMFGYANILRSLSQGRANYAMEPEAYGPAQNVSKSGF